MIRYSLACEREHAFEAWFASSSAYDDQRARGLVTCPACGSTEIGKTLMVPALARAAPGEQPAPAAAPPAVPPPAPQPAPVALLGEKEKALRAMVRAVRSEVMKHAEDVGDRFADEARRIHHGEAEKKSIYGKATPDEARALAEEGVEFHPLPSLPEEGN